jgi:hypothetical protein
MIWDVLDLWVGCGCLTALAFVVLLLVAGIFLGGTAGMLSLLGLVALVGYLVWARRS